MAGSSMTWQVEYARFMAKPRREILRCTHPLLLAGSGRGHSSHIHGRQWLQTSEAYALAKLATTNSHGVVLIVSLNHRIMEEHSVTKLHFCWAQMSCASQSDARGSRVIFASFRDSAGQIQKFAMQFLNASESQSFIDTVKRSLKYGSIVGTLSIDSSMNMQPQGRLLPITEDVYVNTDVEDHPHPNTVDVPVQPSFAGFESAYRKEETTRFGENQGLYPNLPPSFTNFLANCCTEARQDAADLQKATEEIHSEFSFAKYMAGSSFSAMLSKLDRVIWDLGGDLAL